jgi:hypothetical protein
MRLELHPAGPSVRWVEANIERLVFDATGLSITVVYALEIDSNQRGRVNIRFAGRTRHRVLEEVDLAAYWSSSAFASSHFVFEVFGGGWQAHDEQCEGVLSVARREFGVKEWLIRTSNFSAVVISSCMPEICHQP